MDLTLSLSLCITIGGILVSVATAFAVVKTKVTALEGELSEAKAMSVDLKKELDKYREEDRVRIALLEQNQAAHSNELAEIKSDIKTTMKVVQEIKETLITFKKGDI